MLLRHYCVNEMYRPNGAAGWKPRAAGVSKLITHCLLPTALAAAIAFAGPVEARDEPKSIPQASLQLIEDVFARTADLLWEKSDEYFHNGCFERSIALLRLVVEMDPTDVEAFSVAAWLMDSKDRPAEALAFLKRGLALNPNRYELYADLGRYYYQAKDYAKAADYFEKAVKFKDCPEVLWHMLAHSYENGGQIEKSVETWQHAAALEPDNPVVKNNLERVKEKLEDQVLDTEDPAIERNENP